MGSGLYSATLVTGVVWNSPEGEFARVYITLCGSAGTSMEVLAWQFQPGKASTNTALLCLPESVGPLRSVCLRLEYTPGLGILVDRVSVLDRCAGMVNLFNAGKWLMYPGQREMLLTLSGVRRSAVPIPKLARVSLAAPTRDQLTQNIERLAAKCKASDSAASVGPISESPSGDGSVQCTVYIEVPDLSMQTRKANAKNLLWIVARSAARLKYLKMRYASMIIQGKIRGLMFRLLRQPPGAARRGRGSYTSISNTAVYAAGGGNNNNNNGMPIALSLAPRVTFNAIKQQMMNSGNNNNNNNNSSLSSNSGVNSSFGAAAAAGGGGGGNQPAVVVMPSSAAAAVAAAAFGGVVAPQLDLSSVLSASSGGSAGGGGALPSSRGDGSLSSRTDGLAARRRKCMAVLVDEIIDDGSRAANGPMLLPGQISSPLETATGGAGAYRYNPATGMVGPSYIPAPSGAISSRPKGKRKSAPTGSSSTVNSNINNSTSNNSSISNNTYLYPTMQQPQPQQSQQQQSQHQQYQFSSPIAQPQFSSMSSPSSAYFGGPMRKSGSKGSPGSNIAAQTARLALGGSLASPDRRVVEGRSTDLVLPNNSRWPER